MNYKSKKIIKNIDWVGVIDYNLDVFDIEMKTEFGSTYNSYLVRGSEKTALIDAAKYNFKEEYFGRIQSIVDIKDIDYVIMNHTEPDHSGLLKDLLEVNPDLEIYGSHAALMNLKEILNVPFNGHKVANGMTLSLGDKTLEFFIQPSLHWPDTIFTFVQEDSFLFTCDFFGAHYSSDHLLVEECEKQDVYKQAIVDYFEAIMSPFKSFVRKGLDTVKKINPKYVAVSHGLILRDEYLKDVIKLYEELSVEPKKHDVPFVVIPYATAYGLTKKMADVIEETLKEELDGQVIIKMYDLIYADHKEIVEDVKICDMFLVGSSTIVRDTVKVVWELLASINYTMTKGKIASAFGSYGWSGEAVNNILLREKMLQFKLVDEGCKVKFDPSTEQIRIIKDYAKNLASYLKK